MKMPKFVAKIGTFVSKNSPYILCGVGATSITAGAIILAKNAKKNGKALTEKHTAELSIVRDNTTYESEKQKAAAIRKEYRHIVGDYIKEYGVPALLLSSGVMCMFSATMIQTKRLKVVSAAYSSLAASYSSYRERVKKLVGEEKENDLFHNIERDEEGKVIKKEDDPEKPKGFNTNEFSRLFGDGNTPYWDKNTKLCVTHCRGAEGSVNAILREKGFVTLNEVLSELGFQPSEEGMYLGWRYIPGDPIYGETYVDLGFCRGQYHDKICALNQAWNEEFWIDIVPPHSLFGLIPKEKSRSVEDKELIRKRRRVARGYEE